MNRLAYPKHKISPYIILAITYLLYVAVFATYHDRVGFGIASLAVIPVIAGSWYLGFRGGMLTAIFSILANEFVHLSSDHSYVRFLIAPTTIIGTFALFLVALVVGTLGTVIRERREALIRLQELEKERRSYISFLESLNNITRITLEARDLESALKALVERIAKLFKADDGYLALWDETQKTPVPMVAYGSMRDQYPEMRFEAGEHTLAASAMNAGQPLAITDLGNSPYIDPKLSALFPDRAMLVLPLIVQDRRLAVLYLGYNENHSFNQREVDLAEITAQQIALVLTKIQLLEDAQKRLKQLTVLNEVALISTEVESIDQLIERTTEIIGKNLFPDNFGILLMDEEKGILRPHPSYHFVSTKNLFLTDIPLGQGVTGQVGKTGQPIRIGNVASLENYLDVDQRTSSELCVPIKLKDRVLGVINTESTKTDAFSMDDEFLLGTLAGQLATAIEQLRAAAAERQWLDQLAHSNGLIYALAHITTHIEKALSPDEIIQVLGRELKQLNLTCAIAVYDRRQKLFRFNYTSMGSEILERLEGRAGLPLAKYPFYLHEMNLDANTQDLSQSAVISNLEEEIQIIFSQKRKKGFSRILEGIGFDTEVELIRLPLMFEENLLGILWVWGKGITRADLPVMSIFAKQIGISMERARLFQEVQSLAATDSLTGLHNRRSLFELGRIEFSRAHRMNRPFCCMMLDLDHFKQINDTYGHTTGDQILREFAQRCKHLVREMDLVGRYGGEELIILLPETELKTALQVAERLRASIAGTPVKASNQEACITVSIGVATKDEHTLELETLIARADQAMYMAKYRGRNQVAISR